MWICLFILTIACLPKDTCLNETTLPYNCCKASNQDESCVICCAEGQSNYCKSSIHSSPVCKCIGAIDYEVRDRIFVFVFICTLFILLCMRCLAYKIERLELKKRE